MIDYKLRIKTILKRYDNQYLLNTWVRRLNKIAELGGDIISITNYHILEYKFIMPVSVVAREKIFSHIISLITGPIFQIEIVFNKKKDTIMVTYPL